MSDFDDALRDLYGDKEEMAKAFKDVVTLDTLLEINRKSKPLAFSKSSPRRYATPHGYLNPIYLASQMALHVSTPPSNDISTAVKAVSWKLIEYNVPVFFVGHDFASATVATEPPKDWLLSHLKWPLPAMAFFLPLDFMKAYTGQNIPFISTCFLPKGRHTAPTVDDGFCGGCIENNADRMLISWPVILNNLPIDYSSSYPTSHPFDKVMNVEDIVTDYRTEQNSFSGQSPTFMSVIDEMTDLPPEVDRQINSRINSLTIKLILSMTYASHYIEHGSCQRKAKIRRGHERSELWSPNMLGFKYRAKREPSTSAGSTGIVVDWHWRRGHIRDTPFGPLDQRPSDKPELWHRPRWIEPVLVNAKQINETQT